LPRNEVESRHGRVTTEEGIDLDAKDFFWAKNAANPFPQVAEDIDTDLNRYKQDAAEITRSTGVSDVNEHHPTVRHCVLRFSSLTLELKLRGTVTSLRMRPISKLQSRNYQS
jgi:hypothetical protein